jgi:hypothetical protein
VLFDYPELGVRGATFAHLMRLLAEQNSGTFVGITDPGKNVRLQIAPSDN